MGGISSSPNIMGTIGAAAPGDIGTYCFAFQSTGVNVAVGGTVAGSALSKVNASAVIVSYGFTGTWKHMGPNEGNSANATSTLWLRVS